MFDSEGGGYFNQTSNFDSPGGTDKKKDGPKRSQVVFPIVVGMLTQSKSEEFQIWGQPVNLVKIVGIVRKFDVTSTKVNYEIEDSTGRINAVFWLEQEQNNQPNIPVDKEGIYVEVFGTIRTQGAEKLVMILRIQPIPSLNTITTHLLEVINVRYQMEHSFNNQDSIVPHTNPGVTLSNSMMFTAQDAGSGMNPTQSKVFNLIKKCETKVGLSRTHILEQFQKHQHNEVTNAIDFLVSEGHIFSTINSDHFKVTDM